MFYPYLGLSAKYHAVNSDKTSCFICYIFSLSDLAVILSRLAVVLSESPILLCLAVNKKRVGTFPSFWDGVATILVLLLDDDDYLS